MAKTTVDKILKDIAAGKARPVYLVGGDAKHAFIASKFSRRFTDWIIMKYFDRLASSDM